MKRKGFTLIELLAVIVVLAIIALIATPMVLDTIEDAKRGAAVESANRIISAAETKYMIGMLKGEINRRFDFSSDTQLEYKGTSPTSGTIVADTLGNISATLKISGYCIEKKFNDTSPKIIDKNPCIIDDSELVDAENYKESTLNGANPIVSGDLIAVIIENDGTVKKANTKQEWYNYSNKVWANAIILKDKTVSYNDGDIIPENNIESYFVWIPRYRYKIFNVGNYNNIINSKPTNTSKPNTIEIVFENKDIEISKTTTIGSYLTHPAFTSMDVNGIWVGKFETTGTTSALTVKPNEISLRNINVKTKFELSYNYNRSLDSHMLKNTEWGAVAYLSYSKYGINDEVNINNNRNFLTGYSAVEGTDQSSYPGTYGTASSITLPYNTETGYKASTTGNISGVYDMSGGSWENVAAYKYGSYASSGFKASTILNYDSKYFDIYSSNSYVNGYYNRILGDATGEMGPFYYYQDKDGTSKRHNSWFGDYADFINSQGPWFIRGGVYEHGVITGQFNFGVDTGAANVYYGFRLALAG